jgi:hypothetical protein
MALFWPVWELYWELYWELHLELKTPSVGVGVGPRANENGRLPGARRGIMFGGVG